MEEVPFSILENLFQFSGLYEQPRMVRKYNTDYAANILGLCDYKTRLPLFEINDLTKNEVRDCLKDIDLI